MNYITRLIPQPDNCYFHCSHLLKHEKGIYVSSIEWNQQNLPDCIERILLFKIKSDLTVEDSITITQANSILSPSIMFIDNSQLCSCFLRYNNDQWEMALNVLNLKDNNKIEKVIFSNLILPVDISIQKYGKYICILWNDVHKKTLNLSFIDQADLNSTSNEIIRSESCFFPQLKIDNIGELYISWMEQKEGTTSIYVQNFNNKKLYILNQDERFSFRPVLAPDYEKGIWVSWYKNNSNNPDELTNSFSLRLIKNNETYLPVSNFILPDFLTQGEDQSLEFPFIVSKENKIFILCRSSHNFWLVSLDEKGYSNPVQLTGSGWGCRGELIEAEFFEKTLYYSFRDKGGIRLSTINPDLSQQGKIQLKKYDPDIETNKKKAKHKIYNHSNYNYYFGDFHQHSAYSDGTSDLIRWYLRAKYIYEDDFTAITDHESFLGHKTPPGLWMYQKNFADIFNDNNFCSIIGYEWTGTSHPGPGHYCIYLDISQQLISRDKTGNAENLFDEIKKLNGIVIPHHIGWTGIDKNIFNYNVCPNIEVCSCHGQYVNKEDKSIGQRGIPIEGFFAQNFLTQGYKFGFMGGSDGHGLNYHHGITKKKDSHRTGLTVVLAEQLSRQKILEAVINRRCYATSGTKIFLWFELNGNPMGSLVNSENGIIKFKIIGTDKLNKAVIAGNNNFEKKFEVNGTEAEGQLEVKKVNEHNWWFLKVEQENGEMAWSSPIWLI